MKKSVFLSLALTLLMSVAALASNNKYSVDDNAIEAAFDSGVQLTAFDLAQSNALGLDGGATLSAEPNGWVAVILTWVVGGIGIHRVYLGGRVALIPIYFFTCGGIFGIVPLVDFVVLIIGAAKDDIGQYVGNDKFIMWN